MLSMLSASVSWISGKRWARCCPFATTVSLCCLILLLPATLTPATLFPLPIQYHDLLKDVLKRQCKKCNKVPMEPGICLLCGTLVCAGNECCLDESKIGECTQHAIQCGAGCAPFLLVKQCLVFIIRHGAGCRHQTLYLDAYGEEDPYLKRGRPLMLNAERYARLQQLWCSHRLHAEVARANHRMTHHMTWDSI